MPEDPADARELLAIKLSTPHRMLIYLVDKSYIEYQLATHHALRQGCDDKLLAELADAKGLNLEQAKVIWARQSLSQQAVFVQENLEVIHEKNYQALTNVFGTIIGRNVYEVSNQPGIPLNGIEKQNTDGIKASLLRKEVNETKKRLVMRSRGRRKRTIEERGKVRAERLAKINQAIKTISRISKLDGFLEDNIEDLITPVAVASKLEISVSTLIGGYMNPIHGLSL